MWHVFVFLNSLSISVYKCAVYDDCAGFQEDPISPDLSPQTVNVCRLSRCFCLIQLCTVRTVEFLIEMNGQWKNPYRALHSHLYLKEEEQKAQL